MLSNCPRSPPPPAKKVPVEMAYPPVEMGIQPVEMPNQPVGITNQPVEMGIQPVEMANPPVEMTIQPVGMTNQPVDMGNQPVESTNPPVEWGRYLYKSNKFKAAAANQRSTEAACFFQPTIYFFLLVFLKGRNFCWALNLP
ncbi:MAG: hypothetical protein NT166_03540 [Candidatus Aminicenantes bacterium]|nr:hypothetical protein [Candidatus Aminicenantes bacterium]